MKIHLQYNTQCKQFLYFFTYSCIIPSGILSTVKSSTWLLVHGRFQTILSLILTIINGQCLLNAEHRKVCLFITGRYLCLPNVSGALIKSHPLPVLVPYELSVPRAFGLTSQRQKVTYFHVVGMVLSQTYRVKSYIQLTA